MRCAASSRRTGRRSGNHHQFRAVRTVESSGPVRPGPFRSRQTRRAHQRLANSRGYPNQACNPNTCENSANKSTKLSRPIDGGEGTAQYIRLSTLIPALASQGALMHPHEVPVPWKELGLEKTRVSCLSPSAHRGHRFSLAWTHLPMDIWRLQFVLCRKILHDRETARNNVPIFPRDSVQALDRPDVVLSLRSGQLPPRFFLVTLSPAFSLPPSKYPCQTHHSFLTRI